MEAFIAQTTSIQADFTETVDNTVLRFLYGNYCCISQPQVYLLLATLNRMYYLKRALDKCDLKMEISQ